MNRSTSKMRSLAQRLMATELPRASAAHPAATTFPVTDKLRPHLATLVGKDGIRALLARALVLAKVEVSWLQGAQVGSDGNLQGVDELVAELDPTEIFKGRVILLAQLLGLLVAFIGPSLTSRLIGEVWPQIPLDERDFGEENDREKGR